MFGNCNLGLNDFFHLKKDDGPIYSLVFYWSLVEFL